MPFDEEIFERGPYDGFVLSQRFKHICCQFRGTFKVALQMLTSNAVLGALPSHIACKLLSCYMFFMVMLCILIAISFYDEKKSKFEDRTLKNAILLPNELVGRIGSVRLFFIISFISVVTAIIVVWKENSDASKGLWYATYTLVFMYFLVRFLLIIKIN